MTTDSLSLRNDERQFDDREIGRIVRRAAELSGNGGRGVGYRSLPLAEIERAAGDLGIARESVRRAALEITEVKTAQPTATRWLGAPTKVLFERTIEGEIDTEAHEDLAYEIRQAFDCEGVFTVIGRGLRWNTFGQNQRMVTVVVAPRRGRTTITVRESYGQLAGGLFGGIGGGVGGPLLGLSFTLVAVAGIAAFLAGILLFVGVLALVRKFYRGKVHAHMEGLAELTDHLEASARTSAS